MAQITTVTTKNNKSEVTDTQWRGVAASSDSINGTEDLFASFLQPYIEEYSGRTGTAATGAYTKKFTVSVPSNVENQKEKEEFGEAEAEMTIEDSKNGNEADRGFDISIKLVTGSGSDTCTMIILSLAVLMIAGAVVTAAKVNKRADNTDTAFTTGETAGNIGTNSPRVTISEKTEGTGKSVTVPVQVYETKKSGNKKYIYYEMPKSSK